MTQTPVDELRFDVVRVPALTLPAADHAAEEIAVLSAAGLSVALRCATTPAGLPPSLRAQVVSRRCRLLLPGDTPSAALALVDAEASTEPGLTAGVNADVTIVVRRDSSRPDGTGPDGTGPDGTDRDERWPLVVDPGTWRSAAGSRAPAPTVHGAPLVVGWLQSGERAKSPRARHEVRRAVRHALPPGATVVELDVAPVGPVPVLDRVSALGRRSPMSALPGLSRGVAVGWTARGLGEGAAAPEVLAGLDVLLDVSGDQLWSARALAAGIPVWRLPAADGRPPAAGTSATPGVESVPLPALPGRLAALAQDPSARERERLAAESAAREHYGPERLLREIARRGGPALRPAVVPAGPDPAVAKVLLVSSNGAGMGHLTRLLAMARRASGDVEVHLASMSQAVTIAAGEGFPYEYIPSGKDIGIGTRRWNAIFARRFGQALDRLRPAAVVFDGTYPYTGLLEVAGERDDVRLVWSRRAMWKPGRGGPQLIRAGEFDLIIEPGEVAGAADRGLTVHRDDAARVRPIVLLDDDELLDARQARVELGLDPDRPAALVTLGAGNLRDITSDLGAVVAGAAGLTEGLQVCVTRPVIAGAAGALGERVHGLSVYPVSRYSRAFDFAVSATGYNSFHESVAFALPTVLVPNTTQLDDQEARARWADQEGVAVLMPEATPTGVEKAMAVVGDPAARDALARRCREVWPGNGAGDAMALVERLVAGADPAELRSTSAAATPGQDR